MTDTSILQQCIGYASSSITGEIPACQKHKWAALRFLRDVDRWTSGDADFPYEWDEGKALRFFRWFRLFKHRKGILKGRYLEPADIQVFVCGNVYGWYHRETGYRRFRKLYWQEARKNAKTQTLAVIGSYECMAFNESYDEAQEVYCAATKTEQARLIYDEAVAQLRGCKDLVGRFKVAYGRIEHLKTGSIMRALSEEDRRTGDGLNPQCGIVDEFHAHNTAEVYNVLDSGMGARAQPLMAIITTAGFELSWPCYRVEYKLVSDILNPDVPVNLESYFCMVNELDKDADGNLVDDIRDPEAWRKANPIVCSYPEGVTYLKEKLEEALAAPEKMGNFLTKHMNIWVQMRESGYMDMAKWAKCERPVKLWPDLKGRPVIVGLDLSSKIDLTSVAFEFPIGEEYFIKSHSFIPEDTLRARERSDAAPYHLWAEQGYITTVPGAAIDYRVVKAWILDKIKAEGWGLREICLDPWGGAQLTAELVDEGCVVVDIIQGIKTLSEPTKDFRNLVYEGRVVHDGNPVLAFAMSNAVADAVDRNENIILSKKKSRQRIDPAAATINAHVRAMVADVDTDGSRSVLFF